MLQLKIISLSSFMKHHLVVTTKFVRIFRLKNIDHKIEGYLWFCVRVDVYDRWWQERYFSSNSQSDRRHIHLIIENHKRNAFSKMNDADRWFRLEKKKRCSFYFFIERYLRMYRSYICVEHWILMNENKWEKKNADNQTHEKIINLT